MNHEWLCTVDKNGGGPSQTGWKLHAIEAEPFQTLESVKYKVAACGLRAKRGWELDLFIDEKCKRCVKALAKRSKA